MYPEIYFCHEANSWKIALSNNNNRWNISVESARLLYDQGTALRFYIGI